MTIYLNRNDLNSLNTTKLNECLINIKPLEEIKIVNDSTKSQTLKQYIDGLKNCEIMKKFRHCVYFKNRANDDFLEIQYGSTCKIYLDDEELSEEDIKYYLNDEIEGVNLFL